MTTKAAARIQSDEAKKMVGKSLKIHSLLVLRERLTIIKNKVNKEFIMSKPNPNYPSKTGNPSGPGRGNTPKR